MQGVGELKIRLFNQHFGPVNSFDFIANIDEID